MLAFNTSEIALVGHSQTANTTAREYKHTLTNIVILRTFCSLVLQAGSAAGISGGPEDDSEGVASVNTE